MNIYLIELFSIIRCAFIIPYSLVLGCHLSQFISPTLPLSQLHFSNSYFYSYCKIIQLKIFSYSFPSIYPRLVAMELYWSSSFYSMADTACLSDYLSSLLPNCFSYLLICFLCFASYLSIVALLKRM